METKYKITRHFYRDDVAPKIMAMGLTLEEAKDWCKNPETASRTCTLPELVKMTHEFGTWFDGFEEI